MRAGLLQMLPKMLATKAGRMRAQRHRGTA